LVNYLFHKIQRDKQHDYKIICSYIQIYNEKTYDLLSVEPSSGNGSRSPLGIVGETELNIRESHEKGIFIENLAEYTVRNPREVFDLMSLGKTRLVVRFDV
jgi:hypothetical protein